MFVSNGCAGGSNINVNVTPLQTLNYPDNTSMGFTWASNGTGGTRGLVGSFTLRSGGTVSYTYGSSVGGCPGGGGAVGWSYSSLTRTTADGSTQYSSTSTFGGSSSILTTTVLDPGMNKKVYVFLGSVPEQAGFLQSVTRYQNIGSVGSPSYALVSMTKYCYNNDTTCNTTSSYPSTPITQIDTYQYVGTGSNQLSHDVKTYNSNGTMATDVITDSITGQVVATNYAYGTLSNGNCVALGNTNITDHPCSIDTHTGSLTGALIAQSWYTYNSNGALTSKGVWTGSGNSHTGLVTNYGPNGNGTEASMTAPNGQVTNYTYGDCNSLLLTDAKTTVNSIVIRRLGTAMGLW